MLGTAIPILLNMLRSTLCVLVGRKDAHSASLVYMLDPGVPRILYNRYMYCTYTSGMIPQRAEHVPVVCIRITQ